MAGVPCVRRGAVRAARAPRRLRSLAGSCASATHPRERLQLVVGLHVEHGMRKGLERVRCGGRRGRLSACGAGGMRDAAGWHVLRGGAALHCRAVLCTQGGRVARAALPWDAGRLEAPSSSTRHHAGAHSVAVAVVAWAMQGGVGCGGLGRPQFRTPAKLAVAFVLAASATAALRRAATAQHHRAASPPGMHSPA